MALLFVDLQDELAEHYSRIVDNFLGSEEELKLNGDQFVREETIRVTSDLARLVEARRLIREDTSRILVIVPDMDKTADSSGEKKQDNGSKNKRKLPQPSLVPTDKPSSLIEFPRYQSPNYEFNSSEVGPDRVREEPEVKIHELDEWNDSIANQIEELVLSNLQELFRNAIKRIVEFCYSEDVAEKALSRKGLYMVEGDPVSNIVHDTLNILKGKQVPSPTDIVFESFQQMLNYTMVEMISVLREVRPSLTAGEAMWLLLICDFNMSQAFTMEMERDNLSGSVSKGESSASSSNPQSKAKCKASDVILSKKGSSSGHQNCMFEVPKFGSFVSSPKSQCPVASQGVKPETKKSSGTSGEGAQAAAEFSASEGKSGTSAKRPNRREIASLRQRFLHMEKTYRASGKGDFKSGKLANIGGLVLKPPSEILKSGSSNTMSTKIPSADGTSQVSTNAASALPAGDSTGTLPAKDAKSTVLVDNKTSTSDKKFHPKPEPSASDTPKIPDYCALAGIPYDKTLDKYVPRDEKDELILKLIHRVKELQDELQGWTDWANQRVMQVTQRLIKDQTELKTLRKEKQERELFKKEKKLLEENATKKISEMENAVANTSSQIESANSTARMLEAENSKLKKELSTSKLLAEKSVASIQQALEREQMTLKKAQSLESENGLLQDELEKEKGKLANLQQEVDKEKKLQAKVEARIERERAAKEKLLAQAASIRKEREEIEACAKAEEDMIRKKAAADMENYVEEIAKLEKELVELKLKSESGRIAALRGNIDGRNDSSSRDSKSTPREKGNKKSDVSQMIGSSEASGSLKRERECVMCLSEEKSVVFLPCVHQVVCVECNELHEKQGMKECPSCRTPIQLRIHSRFSGH